MTKMKRIAICLLAASTAMISLTGIAASANTVSNSYGSFSWDYSYAQTTNLCNSGSRIVGASVTVYEDNTGDYVTAYYNSSTGGYGTVVKASQSSYSKSKYNFKLYGSVGNSTSSSAGNATSWTKYVD